MLKTLELIDIFVSSRWRAHREGGGEHGETGGKRGVLCAGRDHETAVVFFMALDKSKIALSKMPSLAARIALHPRL